MADMHLGANGFKIDGCLWKYSDILFECGDFWVYRKKDTFLVMRPTATCSESIAAFNPDVDGLSIAIKYCAYRGGNSIRAAEALDKAKGILKK